MRTARRDRLWRDFADWCRGRRLRPLPAHAWTVAAYLRWCERRRRSPSMAMRLRAIARVHVLAGAAPPDRHPLVGRTLRLIEARQRTSRAALFHDRDFTNPGDARAPEPPPAPARRRALRATPRLVIRRPPAD
jgi:hypothetical protein